MILTTKISLASNAVVIPGDPTDPNNPTPVNTSADDLRVLPKTTSGPGTILSGAEVVFTLDEFTYIDKSKPKSERIIESPTTEQQQVLDADKENIKWSFWVSGGLMDLKGEHVVIENDRALKNEATRNYTNTTNKTTFKNNVVENGYLESKIETVTENGVTKNKLTIKFSKWLDGRTIYVEPYRNNPDHRTTDDYTASTTLNAATPEIIDLYWINSQRERVTSTGFETTVTLCAESLGLRNKKVDFSLSDTETLQSAVDWNGEAKKTETIEAYKTLIPYTVEKSNFKPPLKNIDKLYVKVASTEVTTLQTDLKAPVKLSLKQEIIRLFFANRVYSQIDNQFQYKKINDARLGNLVYLVAECTNMDGEAMLFSIKETASRLVAANEKLKVLEYKEQDQIPFVDFFEILQFPKNVFADINDNMSAEVQGNFAATPIIFHELNTPQYNQWEQKLNTFNPAQTSIYIEAQIASINNSAITEGTNNTLTLKPSGTITQHIYHTGQLSKETYEEGIANKVNYIYHAADGKTHDLGTFDLVWAQRWLRGIKYKKGIGWKKVVSGGKTRWYEYDGVPGVNKTPIITIFSGNDTNKVFEFEYKKENGLNFRFSENSPEREYFNPVRLAAVIGAIIDSGFDDVVTNGSVGLDATGAYSVTHINGNNIDFKYLRTDGERPRIDITGGVVHTDSTGSNKVDIERQEKLLDAFYKFGFSETKKNLSWFLPNGNVLKHCVEDAKINEKNKSLHYHHLHLQGFKAKIK